MVNIKVYVGTRSMNWSQAFSITINEYGGLFNWMNKDSGLYGFVSFKKSSRCKSKYQEQLFQFNLN